MRVVTASACLVLMLAGCGGGEPTLADYAEEVEALTTAMYDGTNPIAAELEAAAAPTAGELQRA